MKWFGGVLQELNLKYTVQMQPMLYPKGYPFLDAGLPQTRSSLLRGFSSDCTSGMFLDADLARAPSQKMRKTTWAHFPNPPTSAKRSGLLCRLWCGGDRSPQTYPLSPQKPSVNLSFTYLIEISENKRKKVQKSVNNFNKHAISKKAIS